MRWVIVPVFPEPAPAKISSGPSSVVAASSCCGLSFDKYSGMLRSYTMTLPPMNSRRMELFGIYFVSSMTSTWDSRRARRCASV